MLLFVYKCISINKLNYFNTIFIQIFFFYDEYNGIRYVKGGIFVNPALARRF
jgi:hypothetical protein